MFTFCFTTILFQQVPHAQKKGMFLTLNNHLPLFDAPIFLGFEESADNRFISFSSLGLAMHWEQVNELYHELEVSRISFLRIDDGIDTEFITESFSLGYEFGGLFPRKYNNIKLRMGGGIRYYYGLQTIDDLFNPIERTIHGMIISSNLHLDWRLYKKWYFVMAPSFHLVNGSFRLETVFDPSFQLTDEETSAVDFFFRPFQFLLRFGVSYRLQ